MEFSKILMIFSCFIVVIAFIASIVAWFIDVETPYHLLEFAKWFSAPIVAYMGMAGYVNKAKIETDYLDKNKMER